MKPKRNYKTSTKKPAALDLCQTPPYALEPIIRYLPKDKIIWEPCTGEGILANALRVAGFRVVESDLALGQDLFEYEPPKWHTLVTNPPYGIKPAVLQRCMELQKDFWLLMPTEFQATGAAINLFHSYGISIMNLCQRVDFKMPIEKWFSNAQFPVSWYFHSGPLGSLLFLILFSGTQKSIGQIDLAVLAAQHLIHQCSAKFGRARTLQGFRSILRRGNHRPRLRAAQAGFRGRGVEPRLHQTGAGAHGRRAGGDGFMKIYQYNT